MENMIKLFQEGGLFNTKGRIGRKRFTISMIVLIVSLFVWQLIMYGLLYTFKNEFILILCFALLAPLILFSIAIHYRRLHDINKSGHWYWLIFFLNTAGNRMQQFNPIDVICIIILIYLCAKKGTTGENKYGADPVAPKEPAQ